jgi:hypothetical protein
METNAESPIVPEPAAQDHPAAPRRALRPAWLVLAGALGLLLVAGAFTSMVYLRPPTDGFVRALAGALPYPAAVVNGKPILLRDYLAEHDALTTYLASGSAPEGVDAAAASGNVLETLINKAALSQLAARYGVQLDESRVDELLSQVGGESGDAFAGELDKNFGWTVDEFRGRVVNSLVLASQLSEYVAASEELQHDAKAKAQGAVARLDAGEEFAAVAGDASEDESAKAGGDVGFVPVAQLAGTEYEPILSLKPGEHTRVLSTADAFVVAKLGERVTKPEGEEVRLSVIVVPKRTLEQVVDEYLSQSKIRRLLTRA